MLLLHLFLEISPYHAIYRMKVYNFTSVYARVTHVMCVHVYVTALLNLHPFYTPRTINRQWILFMLFNSVFLLFYVSPFVKNDEIKICNIP